MDTLFLHPGELYAGRRLLLLKTILGSCVAVTLWHPGTKMAGMCHFVLPQRLRHGQPSVRDCDGRYGQDAIEFLLAAARATDPVPAHFQVGVFGGASINETGLRSLTIGANNAQLAQLRLQQTGFRIDQMDIGGRGSRVLQLNTETGVTALKYHYLDADKDDRVVRGRMPA